MIFMVYEFDPRSDGRWADFLNRHSRASVFHTPGWLSALSSAYGYQSAGITTCRPGGDLTNGIVFCDVRSWITGDRLVSVPFADHCEPLADSAAELGNLLDEFPAWFAGRGWRYAEFRPSRYSFEGRTRTYSHTQEFCFHELDLHAELAVIKQGLHRSSVQRRIRRAEREKLRLESGNSEPLLRVFYHLLLQTRKRHGMVPQPIHWFHCLRDAMSDILRITVAFQDDTPVASALSLHYKKTATYKYGCSDARYHFKGAVPLVLWHDIQRAKEEGMEAFDMGRSDLSAPSLIKFKDHWGARSRALRYYRYPLQVRPSSNGYRKVLGGIAARLPVGVLETIGNMLYRHVG
jgi:Acetyltransferase (GNAT) domain